MKISFVAAIIEAVYYSGKVQTVGKRLDRKDFLQYSNAAAGDVIRKIFYDQRELDGETTSFLSDAVEVKLIKVEKAPLGRRILNEKIFQLPRNLGVFGIYNVIDCGNGEKEMDSSASFSRLETGSRWFYTKDRIDDLGIMAFTVSGGKPELYCDSAIDEVAVEAIWKDNDLDVPEYIAYAIINSVLGSTLRVAGFPVDMTADGNPNVKIVNDAMKTALSA